MDYRYQYDEYDYQEEHAHSLENGLNFGLYFCPICDHDTLHQVTNIEYDNYDIKCSTCGTASVTRCDYFDSYEDEAMFWGHEISEFMGDDGEMYL